MNIVDLPVAFLAQMLNFLDTKDNISFVRAIESSFEFDCLCTLVNQTKINLSNLYCLRNMSLSEYCNYFNADLITSINLNYCTSLKWAKVKGLIFKMRFLSELCVIRIELSFADLSLIFKHLANLIKIGFTMPDEDPTQSQHKFSCENLKDLEIELPENSTEDVFVYLSSVFPSISRLTLYKSHKSGTSTRLNECLFPCLKELYMFNEEVYLDSPKLISKLNRFMLNIHSKILNYDLPLDVDFLALEKFTKKFTINDCCCLEKLRVLKIGSRQTLTSIDTDRFRNACELDLSQVHLHLTHSSCESLSKLKIIRYLSLPCCALKLFSSNGLALPKNGIIELSYLTKNKTSLRKFALNGLKTDKQKPCDCNQISYAELIELSQWSDTLKHVSLTNFDVYSSKQLDFNISFERAFLFLKSCQLTHLTIENLTYSEFAWRRGFFNFIRNDSYLTHLHFKGIQIDKPLIDCLSTIKSLTYINIELSKKIPDDICFNNFVNLSNLRYFQMRGHMNSRDVKNYVKKIKIVTHEDAKIVINECTTKANVPIHSSMNSDESIHLTLGKLNSFSLANTYKSYLMDRF